MYPFVTTSAHRFQSTPRSEERGDAVKLATVEKHAVSFNPRPAPKNGATTILVSVTSSQSGFNPRPAPKNGATGSVLGVAVTWAERFNPRPAPKNGATQCCLACSVSKSGFNPRPAPKNGATPPPQDPGLLVILRGYFAKQSGILEKNTCPHAADEAERRNTSCKRQPRKS